jgi:tryptophan-rich sensory protein
VFGPVVARVADLRAGFVICLIMGAAAMVLSVAISMSTQQAGRLMG